MAPNAKDFSMAGDQFLGRRYSDMDCQELVERMLAEVGVKKNLAGSNAWYREIRNNGWTGTPEECRKKFGSIPEGAILFIHAFDGGEEARGYHDGLGNASHIGVKTGRSGADMVRRAGEAGVVRPEDYNFGDGAIHSSSTRQHVATSKFADKSISGGWNMVGLYNRLSYGEAIDRILNGGATPPEPDPEPSPDPDPDSGEDGGTVRQGTVNPAEGGSVFLRSKPSKKDRLWWRIPKGNRIQIDGEKNGEGEKWFHGSAEDIDGKLRTGYMMAQFVTLAEPAEDSAMDPGDGFPETPEPPAHDPYDRDEGAVTITLTGAEARELLPLLDKLTAVIVRQIGRG